MSVAQLIFLPLLATLAGCTPSLTDGVDIDQRLEQMRRTASPAIFFAGRSFEQLPLTEAKLEGVGKALFVYGTCEVEDPDGIFGPEGGSCSPPISIQVSPFDPASWRLAVGCHGRPPLRGVPAAHHGTLVLFTGRSVVNIWTHRRGQSRRVGLALRDVRRPEQLPRRLPPPTADIRRALAAVCPGAVPTRFRDVSLPPLPRGPAAVPAGGGAALIGSVSTRELIEQAPVVFVGTVTALGGREIVLLGPFKNDSLQMQVHRVRFRVEEMLRGEGVDEIDVTNLLGPETAFAASVGQRYLVFARQLKLGVKRVRRLVAMGYRQGVFRVASRTRAVNHRGRDSNLDQLRFFVRTAGDSANGFRERRPAVPWGAPSRLRGADD